MKVNPKIELMKRYYEGITFRKIYPLFFYTQCNICGMKFKREKMFECEETDLLFENHSNYFRCCKECGINMENFKKISYEKFLIPEEKFQEVINSDRPFSDRMVYEIAGWL